MALDNEQLSLAGRKAASSGQWSTVVACSKQILDLDSDSAEGFFLAGLAAIAARNGDHAIAAFERALSRDNGRYDAAIELANLYCAARRNGQACAVLSRYEKQLGNSPRYLHMAGNVYSGIGLPERAWLLYKEADRLQPGIELFEASLATCAVFLGKTDEARRLYGKLLECNPTHQRNHYQLARLDKATDTRHIDAMLAVLEQTQQAPERNVFMYYAIGKEYEDLERWEDAFEYFERAGNAVATVARYDVNDDLRLIETVIETCSASWLAEGPADGTEDYADRTPVFVVGLPRTGTTLTERIIAAHPDVQSVGETQFMQMAVRELSGVQSTEKITPAMIEAAASLDVRLIGSAYRQMLGYRLDDSPYFVDKLPFNILYAGFIAKAFPNAKIVVVNRHPMDACFAMYKQVFTWAYKFSYTLDGLASFYPAYRRLLDHWRQVLSDRLIEIDYETLVRDPEPETRRLIDALKLRFDPACLEFEKSTAATSTASAVQVREKVHTRSVGRWRRYETQLEPLRRALADAGIDVD